jgi:hypothetical protein
MIKNKIYEIKRGPENNFVFRVVWGIVLEDEGKQVDRYVDELSFTQESDSFIPYESLTEEMVWSWVENRVGHVKLAQIEDELIKKYEGKKEQELNALVSGKPW